MTEIARDVMMFILGCVLLVLVRSSASQGPIVGGLNEVRPATANQQQLCDQVKSDLETKASRTFTTYKAISYRTQVVSGINYFIKVDVGDQYYHLRIFNPLPYMNSGPSLVAYQRGKTGKSELSYFK